MNGIKTTHIVAVVSGALAHAFVLETAVAVGDVSSIFVILPGKEDLHG